MPRIGTSSYSSSSSSSAKSSAWLRSNVAGVPPSLAASSPSPRSGGGGGSSSVGMYRPLRRGNRRNPRIWMIGGCMFCLVLVYVAVVIAVTRSHLSSSSSSSSGAASSLAETAAENQPQPAAHISPLSVLEHQTEQLQTHQQQKHQEPGEKEKKNEPPKKTKVSKEKKNTPKEPEEEKGGSSSNYFRLHNFNNSLNHNVKPELLIPGGGGGDDERAKQQWNKEAIEAAVAYRVDPPKSNHPTPEHVLTAFLESPNFEEWDIQPLPVRRHARAEALHKKEYTRVNSCQKLTQQWPVDDTPSEEDPFLPWIHDVFPTADGKSIQFVAQNRRRCRTGMTYKLNETDILMNMQPQVALFQHVPIQRTKDGARYRLSTHKQADPDGLATRFICRFKPTMEETLSVFNFDYDWIAYRKRHRYTFEKNEGGIKSVHTSQLTFKCPVPDHLQESIRLGTAIHNDWATLFVDLVPIRTPPRYGSPTQFLQPRYQEFQDTDPSVAFDPIQHWGDHHILPKIEDSGRWENIPICLPSLMQYEKQTKDDVPAVPQQRQVKHRLVSCIWASAGYTTRGNRFAVNDGQRRMLEWLSYNKVIGFDHFYLYDNTGAFDNNETSLKPIADLFPDHVTYIPWPSKICNNRPNNVPSPGERSSQYAAEASCRLRFGPHVDWIGQFDIDEYLVPMGDHTGVKSLLDKLEREDIRIISFGSWRAWPRWAYIGEIHEINDRSVCWRNDPCFELTIPTNTTMLQAYNCDRQLPGQKSKQMPAEKQLYRPDYVTHHFIHYSTVTKLAEMNRTEHEAEKGIAKFKQKAFPDLRQRFGDEVTEALMLHTKAVALQDTAGYKRFCHVDNAKLPKRDQGTCRLGIPWPKPWPKNTKDPPVVGNREGYAYNCFVNEQIEYTLVPRLEAELKQHLYF